MTAKRPLGSEAISESLRNEVNNLLVEKDLMSNHMELWDMAKAKESWMGVQRERTNLRTFPRICTP